MVSLHQLNHSLDDEMLGYAQPRHAHPTRGDGAPTMEFLMSKPLLPEAEKSHLQKVLAALVSAVEALQGKVSGIENKMGRLSETSDENTQNVHYISAQTKQLSLQIESLRSEPPMKRDVEEMRKGQASQQEAVVEIRGVLDVVRGMVDQRGRAADDFKASLTTSVETLQRDVETRNRSVTEAMNDLANRVDCKTETADLDKVVAQVEDANKRQHTEIETMRRQSAASEELVKRQAGELEQLRLTLISRDRQHAEQVTALEAAIEAAGKRSSQAALTEMNDLRSTIHIHTRKVDESIVTLERDIDGRVGSMEQRLATRLDEIVSRRTVGMDDGLQRLRELVNRMQGDIAATNDHVTKVESDFRGSFNRMRDDTDHKLLELLNAVQGVEHAKSALERQVAEAGRIMCQGIPIFTSAVADSPPSLKGRHSHSHSHHHHQHSDSGMNDPERRDSSFSPTRPPAAAPHSGGYKGGPGALCSCDDDIF
eukprot:TRINITY_DN29272_c0_g1_i1.p1 TRINITY_DN29272_c0_g1~~TRINITY_DN29272_c0_g1_i1.p1  ORF type:complete len:482 (+),score=221.59 TRINITY_DN29272_c0_g1_i1:105-1550(+)